MTNHSKLSCEKKTKNVNRSEQKTFKAQWIFSDNSPSTIKSWDDSLSSVGSTDVIAVVVVVKNERLCPVWLCLATGQKSDWSASEGSTHAVRTHHIFPSFHVTLLSKSVPSAVRERSVAWQGRSKLDKSEPVVHSLDFPALRTYCMLRYLIASISDWFIENLR